MPCCCVYGERRNDDAKNRRGWKKLIRGETLQGMNMEKKRNVWSKWKFARDHTTYYWFHLIFTFNFSSSRSAVWWQRSNKQLLDSVPDSRRERDKALQRYTFTTPLRSALLLLLLPFYIFALDAIPTPHLRLDVYWQIIWCTWLVVVIAGRKRTWFVDTFFFFCFSSIYHFFGDNN